jgi:hypothetical protein
MAGTTTNFAIPYPSSTDYVTDGATAMKSLADQVDAVLFTGSSSGNLLINGAMQVTQRSAVGTAVTGITTSGYYTADRFQTLINTLGTWSQTTIADAPTGSGFRNCVKLDCTTADASPAAGDYLIFRQQIEGQNLQAIRKGTASAQTLTLSFWVKSFQTGTFIVELEDSDNNRGCSKSYTVNVSNVWEYKTVTYPADVTGVFDNDANSSCAVNFWLGAGTTYTSGTLATTWGTLTSANRAVGQINVASATTGEWFMTGAQLTVGSVATPFEFKSFADDLRDCQRYFQRLLNGADNTNEIVLNVQATGATGGYGFKALLMIMRTSPTITSTAASQYLAKSSGGTNITMNAMTFDVITPRNFLVTIGVASGLVAGNASLILAASASATIDASAEFS